MASLGTFELEFKIGNFFAQRWIGNIIPKDNVAGFHRFLALRTWRPATTGSTQAKGITTLLIRYEKIRS